MHFLCLVLVSLPQLLVHPDQESHGVHITMGKTKKITNKDKIKMFTDAFNPTKKSDPCNCDHPSSMNFISSDKPFKISFSNHDLKIIGDKNLYTLPEKFYALVVEEMGGN